MKKATFLAAMVALMTLTVGCDDETIIPVDQLPMAAQTYIQENQPDTKVLYVKKERELFSTTYKVMLENRMEIEFDGDGMPIDMDIDD